MKLTIPCAIFVFFALALPVLSQDWKLLEKAADDVKDTAEKLADSSSGAFRKGRQNSSDAIEQSFLAEQTVAATKLMSKIVDDKYEIGDLRLSASVLSALSERFPSDGDALWSTLKDKIASLVFELGRDFGRNSDPDGDGEAKTVSDPEAGDAKILGRFFWNGEVDDELQLAIRGTRLTHRTVNGRTLPDGAYSFTSALPRENGLTVSVEKLDGRGEAVVIQQPNASNDYSAIIRIRDDDSGSRPYSLEIYWFKKDN